MESFADMSELAVYPGHNVNLASITPDTALAIRSNGREYLVTPKDIISWVAPQAPLGEAKKHLVICQTLSLNPLLGEAYLLPLGGKWTSIIAKSGYLKCARNDPHYNGHESGVVVQAFQKSTLGKIVRTGEMVDILGQIVPDGFLLCGGWCKVYRKGIDRPFYKRVSINEYMKDVKGGTWTSIPCTMIEKVAIAHAMREAIDLLAGTYDESEIDRNASEQIRPIQATVQQPPTPAVGQAMLASGPKLAQAATTRRNWEPGTATIVEGERPRVTDEQIDEVTRLVIAAKVTASQYATMLDKRGVTRLDDLDTFQAGDIISKLSSAVSRSEWNPLNQPVDAANRPIDAPEEDVIDVEVTEIQENPEVPA